MKRTVRTMAACVAAVLLLAACSGPAPVQAYKAERLTAETVDVLMTIAGQLWNEGKISPEQRDSIIKAHNVYRVAGKALAVATKVWADAVQKFGTDSPAAQAAAGQAAKKSSEFGTAVAVLQESLSKAGVK